MGYIRFENIVKNFGSTQVLKNINLDIEKGQLVTLLGPSGCGKSTLLRCLAGLETVTSGKIWLDGKEITNVEPRKRDIGMVFQQYSLFPNLTVEKNVAFGLQLKKMSKNQIDTKVKEMLEIVGLGDKGKNYPSQLSGGQQQRAALARAIVTEPKVLLSRFLQLMRFSANLCRWRSGEFRGRQILRPFLLPMIRMRQWSCRI